MACAQSTPPKWGAFSGQEADGSSPGSEMVNWLYELGASRKPCLAIHRGVMVVEEALFV